MGRPVPEHPINRVVINRVVADRTAGSSRMPEIRRRTIPIVLTAILLTTLEDDGILCKVK